MTIPMLVRIAVVPFSIFRILRRKFLKRFWPSYIHKSIERRKGECRRCGCCGQTLSRCKHFKDGGCLLWKEKGWSAMPEDCRNYPFDELDKSVFARKNCGYFWD